MSAFNIWAVDPPPRDVPVWAKYKLLDEWQIVRTCKRGCCVSGPLGLSMTLPSYWKAATHAEWAERYQSTDGWA